jgi:hypothetical protein
MNAPQQNDPMNTMVNAIAEQVAARVAEILRETKAPKLQPKYHIYESAGQCMDMSDGRHPR